jgi:soluble lytic murein transglycosylase
MNWTRRLITIWLAAALAACSNPASNGATPTPGLIQNPGATPTPTATPAPPPTPTPTPVARVESGDQSLFYGNYEQARLEYQSALADSSAPEIRAAALWGLGRVDYSESRYAQAISTFTLLTTTYPETIYSAWAYFMLGETNAAIKRYPQAAEAYAAYLSARPGVLDSFVHERRGDMHYTAVNYSEALTAYTSGLHAPRLDDGLSLEVKAARTRAALGDYANALAAYDDIAARSGSDYTKAQMDYFSGSAYLAIGQPEEAYKRFLHTVENYPLAYESYQSLVELVNANVPVSDLDRGLVDYFAKQYDVALAAFDRYLAANPKNDGTAHYYRALSLREFGRNQDAIEAWTYFVGNYSAHPRWVDAWEDKAYTQWAYEGQYTAAAQTLLDFVSVAPSHSRAHSFLFNAGRIYERAGKNEEAAAAWQRLAEDYPGLDTAPQALFLAGIIRYRDGKIEPALALFQRSLSLSVKQEDQARAHLWIGKASQQLGDISAANAAWQQAQSVNPSGYYGQRARDLFLGLAPFEPPSIYQPVFDLDSERQDAAGWVRVTFNLSTETDLSGPGLLGQDPRLIRGTELWQLGLYQEARTEFENLRQEIAQDPADGFRLGNYLLDLGAYRSGIFALRQVLTLAGLEEQAASLRAPAYFNHVRYGLYYNEIVTQAAEKNGQHPIYIFSVMRQESLFEGFVRSTAGARGLMQIIPSTGASLAAAIGWPPNYTDQDLYRPIVSINLGAYYLARNQKNLGNNPYATLAAYNAGPGNARIWWELAGDDPDLFLETVRFIETRNYIRAIYEFYTVYYSLYSPVS